MTKGISILVADDHPLFRKGMVTYLKSLKVGEKIYEADNGHEVLKQSEGRHIDLFLLDVRMPGLDGYETAKLLLAKNPKARIIINTMYDGSELVNGLLNLGVRGFLLKGEDIDHVEEAIKKVMHDDSYVSPALIQIIDKHIKTEACLEFTPDEIKLVKLLSKGNFSNEIAVELGLSLRTVETYRYRLIKRLGVANSLELVDYFHRNGLV